VSELRSVVDALRSEVLSGVPDARIEEDFTELHRVIEALELERLRRLAELERRGVHARDGHLSVAAWLASCHRVGFGSAREQARLARSLEAMPRTRQALEAGALSLPQARVLAGAREVDPETFERDEGVLLEAASRHSVFELARVVAFWRERVDEARMGTEARLRARRGLHASRTLAGMVRLDGDLDPESGETVLTALGAVLDHEARSGTGEETSDGRHPGPV
jgi:Domain of unknown function (DUF222)